MLYKVLEGAAFPYDPYDPFLLPSTAYNEFLITPPRQYVQSMNAGDARPWFVWTGGQRLAGNIGSNTYGLGFLRIAEWPSWAIATCNWDSRTGDMRWHNIVPTSVMGMITYAHTRRIFQDTAGRLWVNQVYGYTHRLKLYGPGGINAKAEGMPVFFSYDYTISGGEWKEEDGTTQAVNTLVCYVIGIALEYDIAFITYEGGSTTVHLHRASDKVRIGTIKAPDTVFRVSIVNRSIAYMFGSRGSIIAVDYLRRKVLGVNYFDASVLGNQVNYDPINARIITFFETPDDEDGKGNCKLEAWANVPVGSYLQKPIPLRKPRVGNTVPVITRCVGDHGEPMAGVKIRATLTGPNSIAPPSVVTDSAGWAKFYYTSTVAGASIDDITVTAEIDDAAPGLGGDVLPMSTIPPPTQVAQEDYFFPGHWIFSDCRDQTKGPAAKWGHIVATPEHGIVGVVQEYTWGAIEPVSLVTVDYSCIDADIAFCEANGLKYMFAIATATPYHTFLDGGFGESGDEFPGGTLGQGLVPDELERSREPSDLISGLECWHHELCHPEPWPLALPPVGIDYTSSKRAVYVQLDHHAHVIFVKNLISNICAHLYHSPAWVGVFPVHPNFLDRDDMRVRRFYDWAPGTQREINVIVPELQDYIDGLNEILHFTDSVTAGRMTFCPLRGTSWERGKLAELADTNIHPVINFHFGNSYQVGDISGKYKTFASGINMGSVMLNPTNSSAYDEEEGDSYMEVPINWKIYSTVTGDKPTAFQLLRGGPGYEDFEEPLEPKQGIEQMGHFWFVFWPNDESMWDGEDGLAAVSFNYPLTLTNRYYGT